MNFVSLLDSVFDNLPDMLIYNDSFNEIKHQVLDVFNGLNESEKNNFSFRVREDMVGDIVLDDFENNVHVVDENFSELCGIEFGNEKLFFSVMLEDDNFKVSFMCSFKGKHYKDISISLSIDSQETSWDILSVVKDENEFYYDYKHEFFSLTNDKKLVVSDNVDEKEDLDFSNFFGVSVEESRNLRLNFASNRDYINRMLANKDMKFFDQKYCEDFVVFDGPINANELGSLFLGEELINVDGESKSRLDSIVSNIVSHVGVDGELVVSHNLVMNVQAFVYLDYNVLSSNGFIVKNVDGVYTLFNLNVNDQGVIVIPSSISKDNLLSLYNSSGNSEHTRELDEFFGIVNVKKLSQ